jgi:hypothetical protein
MDDQEDADTDTGGPCGRTSETIRKQQHDQPDECQLDDVEGSESRGCVHDGLQVHLRLWMDDFETRERDWWHHQQHPTK